MGAQLENKETEQTIFQSLIESSWVIFKPDFLDFEIQWF